jgi:hypothetical protein
MAVTANQLIQQRDGCLGAAPVEESVTLYQGTLAFINASGYADDDIASGANVFAGIVKELRDNSAGGDGDLDVELYQVGEFLLTGSSFTQATVGKDIYASDNYTITTSPATAVRIGKCTRYHSTTQVWVKIEVSVSALLNYGTLTIDDISSVVIGAAGDTVANRLTIFDGGADKPAMLVLYSGEATGVPYYFWVDSTGDLRKHTAVPTDEDGDGVVVGTQS